MVGILTQPAAAKPANQESLTCQVDHYWNPNDPKFYEHLVYGAGKPRCVLPLEALKRASAEDDTLIVNLRQQYTQAARDGPEALMNLALFLLIVDNDLSGGGDLLKDAAKRFPCGQTLCQYARFLYNMKKDYTVAWQLFERALQADPMHVDTIGYYAGFVASVQRDYDKAEALYQRCLQIAPMHANHLGGYARFLAICGHFQEAEACFERSIAADPSSVVNLNNYAAFLAEVQKDFERAEKYFRQAVEIDPSCGFAVRNLLNFLVWMRGDNDAAKQLWQHGGAEALRQSLDETYHPDEICPAVRDEMAAEARFMEQGKRALLQKQAASQPVPCDESSSMCVSCSSAPGVCSIARMCNSQCEGPACSCVQVSYCIPCILRHYWHDSKGDVKSFARCPTCRSEFCFDDLVVAAEQSDSETGSDCSEMMQ